MCMIDGADEPWTLYQDKVRTARKEHVCGECSTPIQRGQQYFWGKGLYDRYWSEYRMCMDCKTGPADWLMDQCGGWLWHGVSEDLREHWEERDSLGITDAEILGLGRMLVAMRHRSRAAAMTRMRLA